MMESENPYASPNPFRATGLSPSAEGERQVFDVSGAVSFAGSLTKEDLRAGFRLHKGPLTATRIVMAAILMLFAASSGVFFWKDPNESWFLPLGALLLFGIAINHIDYWIVPSLRAMRAARDPAGICQFQRRMLCNGGMAFEIASQAGTAAWTALAKYRNDEQVAIVYLMPARRGFFLFPRRLLESESDWQRLLQLLRDHLPYAQ